MTSRLRQVLLSWAGRTRGEGARVVWQCCVPLPLVPLVSLWPTRLVVLGRFVLFRGGGCLGVPVPLLVVGQAQVLGEAAQAISQ